jgi:hypothetical protein
VQKIPTYVDLDRGDRVGRRCQTADTQSLRSRPARLSRQSQATAGSGRFDPFTKPSINDRYWREGDGWTRREAAIAAQGIEARDPQK